MVTRTGEILDYIMTTDLRIYFETEEVRSALYQSAREASSKGLGDPITTVAGKKIIDRVKQGDIFVVTTGWRAPYRPPGESDGPLGAVVLARAIAKACEATPVLLAEEEIAQSLVPLCKVAGLNVLDLESAKAFPSTVHIRSIPIGENESKKAIESIFPELNPSCVISVERPGRNEMGVHHYTRGVSCSEGIAYLDYFLEEAWRRKVLTIGIGDLGNELGLGKIKETVGKYIKYGSKCLCPCGGGIAASDPAEVTVFSTVSNWGAYGIAAALAVLKEDLDVFHTGDIERQMLRTCIVHGVVDGALNIPSYTVDTIPGEADVGVVEMMRVVIQKSVEKREK
jgi:hypothetical protein